MTAKYCIKNRAGDVIEGGFTRLADAVLAAAAYDGFGSEFKRGEDGLMRLYSGSRHIGNNPYHPKENEAFFPESGLADDELAKDQVAREVVDSGAARSIRPENHRSRVA